MTINSHADWFREGDVIRVRLPDGTSIAPSASEVVGAEFKSRHEIRGQTVPRCPSESIPTIEFNRFPPDVIVRVLPPSADLTTPAVCRLELLSDGVTLAEVPPDLTDDQILIGNSWFPLIPDSLREAGEVLNAAGVDSTGQITLREYATLRSLPSTLLRFSEPQAPTPAGPSAELLLPSGFTATLYPYQADGVRWLKRIAAEGLGCFLADEMGLGKTVQVIAILSEETEADRTPSLVICPATLLENWRRELNRFTPALRVLIHRGQGRTGFPSNLRPYDVVLTTYDTASRDLPLLKMIPWNAVVLDEAQAIKTPDAQRSIAVKEIPRRIAIAMTGTPVENRLRDLWSIMDFAAPGFLGTLADFESAYTDSMADAARLEPVVSPLMLRRRVATVATDLPPRIDIPQPIELAELNAVEYDAIRQQIAAEYGAAANLVAIIKLRLYCTHPFLINDGCGDPLPHSTKYARLVEILEEVIDQGDKCLIFTSFTKMADILAANLPRRFHVPCSMIDGRTSISDRQPAIDAFENTPAGAILILNPKAAGVGLNITAASHVIHYNLEWNPAVEDQATARAYRRGQDKPVTVHRLYHANTIEEVIDQRVARKRDIAGQAVVGVQGAEDDVADILRVIELSPVRPEGDAYAR
mgnify:CR=1 FL=1